MQRGKDLPWRRFCAWGWRRSRLDRVSNCRWRLLRWLLWRLACCRRILRPIFSFNFTFTFAFTLTFTFTIAGLIIFFAWTSMLAMLIAAATGERGLRCSGTLANRLVYLLYGVGTVAVFPAFLWLIAGLLRAL